jgi:hypothetical protein
MDTFTNHQNFPAPGNVASGALTVSPQRTMVPSWLWCASIHELLKKQLDDCFYND